MLAAYPVADSRDFQLSAIKVVCRGKGIIVPSYVEGAECEI